MRERSGKRRAGRRDGPARSERGGPPRPAAPLRGGHPPPARSAPPHRGGHELLYGRQPVLELLRVGRREVYRLWRQARPQPSAELAEIEALAARRGIPIEAAEFDRLAGLTGDAHHQGVAVEVSHYPYASFQEISVCAGRAGQAALVLLLDHIQDPQNVGSLLRSAEAAGVDGVLIPKDRAAGVTPAAVRASAGASEHVRVALVTNLVRAMGELKEAGLWMVGLEAVPNAVVYTAADLRRPLGLVVGSEGGGLGRLVRETCDDLVRIPLRGRVASLNAGVAGALALYEARRQGG